MRGLERPCNVCMTAFLLASLWESQACLSRDGQQQQLNNVWAIRARSTKKDDFHDLPDPH